MKYDGNGAKHQNYCNFCPNNALDYQKMTSKKGKYEQIFVKRENISGFILTNLAEFLP